MRQRNETITQYLQRTSKFVERATEHFLINIQKVRIKAGLDLCVETSGGHKVDY